MESINDPLDQPPSTLKFSVKSAAHSILNWWGCGEKDTRSEQYAQDNIVQGKGKTSN